ncbi:MAG: DNA polymerase III subunit delta' [Candidatus Omnitrophota bacterium]|nr:DNA polymerase III subunit delta' [Candidatus Omnitrophota bacterium]
MATEIKGNESTQKILLDALKSKKLASTLLFVGPEGVGKSLMAKYLAKSVNCLESDFNCCNRCNSCAKIENLNHPDVHWITSDDSGSIKIEQVRGIEGRIQLRPYEAKKKVFIIVEAQDLTPEASNALLKTLEEPPQDSLIILTSAHADQLLPTILSRCQRFFFSGLRPDVLEGILTSDYKLDEKLAHFLAYFSEGRIGKAIRFSQTDILKQRDDFLHNFLNSFSSQQYFDNNFFEDKKRLTEGLGVLVNWFRDILISKIGLGHSYLVNKDRSGEISALKENYSLEDLQEILEDIILTRRLLQQNINAKISFSTLRAKICQG